MNPVQSISVDMTIREILNMNSTAMPNCSETEREIVSKLVSLLAKTRTPIYRTVHWTFQGVIAAAKSVNKVSRREASWRMRVTFLSHVMASVNAGNVVAP